MLKDAYTGEDVPTNSTSDLDHVMTAKEIHDDRGRSLAGLKGTDLQIVMKIFKRQTGSRTGQRRPMIW